MDDLPVDDELIARAMEYKEIFERQGIRSIPLEDYVKALREAEAAIRDPKTILEAINRVVGAASEVEEDSDESDFSDSRRQ